MAINGFCFVLYCKPTNVKVYAKLLTFYMIIIHMCECRGIRRTSNYNKIAAVPAYSFGASAAAKGEINQYE